MQTAKASVLSVPFPSKWAIHVTIGGKPIVWGQLIINSIIGYEVVGTINFRGIPIPIQGYWNEVNKQITFDSTYATYLGNLTIYDDPPIRIRHFVLSGNLVMNPPSLQAGERGTWIATTDINLNEYSISGKVAPYQYSKQLPPVGVFLTSNLLHQFE
ncbi:hypothetical protein [Ferviditalea candida]|uniref:Uncharacterized protein n=1 Tax=Ferviditalea candida TaxID=3108399 RepID=A0ABU5ZLP7_9BACL|nr:hypothetical protein [Paenibacillaceae bacterium T2]